MRLAILKLPVYIICVLARYFPEQRINPKPKREEYDSLAFNILGQKVIATTTRDCMGMVPGIHVCEGPGRFWMSHNTPGKP